MMVRLYHVMISIYKNLIVARLYRWHGTLFSPRLFGCNCWISDPTKILYCVFKGHPATETKSILSNNWLVIIINYSKGQISKNSIVNCEGKVEKSRIFCDDLLIKSELTFKGQIIYVRAICTSKVVGDKCCSTLLAWIYLRLLGFTIQSWINIPLFRLMTIYIERN